MASASAADAGIHKKIIGSRTVTLVLKIYITKKKILNFLKTLVNW